MDIVNLGRQEHGQVGKSRLEVGAAELKVAVVLGSHLGVRGQRVLLEEEVVKECVDNSKCGVGDVLGGKVDGATERGDVCDADEVAHDCEEGDGGGCAC